jgi:hypothetical protein
LDADKNLAEKAARFQPSEVIEEVQEEHGD